MLIKFVLEIFIINLFYAFNQMAINNCYLPTLDNCIIQENKIIL